MQIRIQLFTLMRIRILLLIKVIEPQVNHCEPTGLHCELLNFDLNADPDPAPYLSDGNLRHLGYRPSRAPFVSLQAFMASF